VERLRRHYAKVCELSDFDDRRLRTLIGEIAPGLAARPPHRKAWEYATSALFLEEVGGLGEHRTVLDVGAGADPILYWLANRTGTTVGIDIYGDGGFADREGELTMLHEPGSHAPYPYPTDRLDVRYMDATALDFPDDTFDAVVSFSSIEHFGGRRGITKAAREIGRVLRPGGHAFIVTEAFVDYGVAARPVVQSLIRAATFGRRCRSATPRQRAWPEVLTERELRGWIVGPSGLELMQPVRTAVDAGTRASIVPLTADGSVPADRAKESPHVLLGILGSAFSSIALPLVKPG
jgi:SAM-dependent methyltransferase